MTVSDGLKIRALGITFFANPLNQQWIADLRQHEFTGLGPDGDNLTEPLSPNKSGGQDLEDESLLFAPDWSANLNAQYVIPLGSNLELVSGVDINYTDEFYSALDLDPNTKHDDATKINARIALASVDGTWSVAVIGKNLTDEKTYIWNNDVPVTDSNSYFGLPERPRSIAVQARYRF